MNQPSFAVQTDRVLEQLQDRLEALEALEDADIDLIDGVLTVAFDDGGQMILNRQEASRQIWLSSVLGPAHFSFDAERSQWIDDRNGRELTETVAEALEKKTGQAIAAADLS